MNVMYMLVKLLQKDRIYRCELEVTLPLGNSMDSQIQDAAKENQYCYHVLCLHLDGRTENV